MFLVVVVLSGNFHLCYKVSWCYNNTSCYDSSHFPSFISISSLFPYASPLFPSLPSLNFLDLLLLSQLPLHFPLGFPHPVSFSFFFFIYSPHFPNSFIIRKLVQFSLVCQAPLQPTKGPVFRFYFCLYFLQPVSTNKRLICPLENTKTDCVNQTFSFSFTCCLAPEASSANTGILLFRDLCRGGHSLFQCTNCTRYFTAALNSLFPVFPLSLVLTGITSHINYLQFQFTKQH